MAPPDLEHDGLTDEYQHGFLNISVNPLECSIVCHTSWAKNVFQPFIDGLPKEAAKAITISSEEYLVISVINAGMEAASRVMELTCPLALISIFFITTYYSDFILIPSKSQQPVTEALLEHGFHLADNGPDYTSKGPATKGYPSRTTTPPLEVAELQARTFDLLRKGGVIPYIEEGLRLVQCSGRETANLTSEFAHHSSRRQAQGNGHDSQKWLDNVDTKLYTALVSAFVSQPRFLSVTLAKDDPPSLLLDRNLLGIFGDSLMGDTEDELVPIFLDLSGVPFEVTGVICGVAGKIVTDMEDCSVSYLSTVRSGAVILSDEQAVQVLGILKPALEDS